MLAFLFATFVDRIPNKDAIALSPTAGYLLLACAMCIVSLFILHSEKWRRWWLSAEDPRSVGLFRILFGFFVLANINGLWEYFHFLFTDEGILPADVAREVFASRQFQGFGDGFSADEPWGFFDVDAVMRFLSGPKYSLLYFWDSPRAFWLHLAAFELFGAMFMIGFFTRTSGVLTFFLMNSLFFRNHLWWEGTELVFRCFLVYLVVAKAGRAYSVDNWLRCRRLRKRGLLSERDGPGQGAGLAPDDDHPQGLQAIYRRIPAWPRRLMVLQLATIYLTTGLLKNGAVWYRGDALYYALNMDHFYRLPPQFISSVFGTNLFRLMTWTVKWWQMAFFLVVVSLIVRWTIRQGFPAFTGVRKWLASGLWLALLGFAGGVIYVTWPVHYTPFDRKWFALIWVVSWAGLWWFWWRLGHKPFVVRKLFGVVRLAKPATIDRMWFCSWILGRRVLLTLGIVFQSHIIVLMNVGQFQTAMLSATIPLLTGVEVAAVLSAIGRVAARVGVPGVPRSMAQHRPLPPEDPSLPHLHRDPARLPQWALGAALAIVVVGVLVRVWVNPSWNWLRIWGLGAVFLAGVSLQRWLTHRGRKLPAFDSQTGRARAPWAYGPWGRFLIGGLVVWHVTAVAVWLLPDKDSLRKFRGTARQVFAAYLTRTTTDQGWGMFAPNPPRSNVFMKVLVTDADGEVWDMRTDVYAPERKPIPWVWNDRARKMNRRIIGGESGGGDWYRKWYARWQCRDWSLRNEGQTYPQKVELVKIWYRIPTPEEVRDKGWYVPEDLLRRSGHEAVKHTEYCENAVMGQVPNWIRRRHGLPEVKDSEYRPWIKHKKRKWDLAQKRRQERKTKAAAAREK